VVGSGTTTIPVLGVVSHPAETARAPDHGAAFVGKLKYTQPKCCWESVPVNRMPAENDPKPDGAVAKPLSARVVVAT
jgi:hypothetical protein